MYSPYIIPSAHVQSIHYLTCPYTIGTPHHLPMSSQYTISVYYLHLVQHSTCPYPPCKVPVCSTPSHLSMSSEFTLSSGQVQSFYYPSSSCLVTHIFYLCPVSIPSPFSHYTNSYTIAIQHSVVYHHYWSSPPNIASLLTISTQYIISTDHICSVRHLY